MQVDLETAAFFVHLRPHRIVYTYIYTYTHTHFQFYTMSTGKVILVTGANRGLGYSILQVAGARDPSATFIMTSRKLEAGQEAAAKLAEEGIKAKIEVLALDVTNDDQVLETVKYVEEKHGKLDGM